MLSPFIRAANAIPRVVLGSLFAIMFGLSVWGKASTAVVLVFFVVFFNAFQGVREVDRNLIANARILGADNRRLTTEIIIPSAMSWILASLHIRGCGVVVASPNEQRTALHSESSDAEARFGLLITSSLCAREAYGHPHPER